ncbi:tRNA (adenosine(37)-N6)-threonylcarbamoyltransferase complex dimerization subunit type 1 TsaB [Desulfobulbus sp.]|uniref:tRNA (adenosine(37)-N6)-threonylcarbamoyltransferase complex dimerization subunit type 1 TsaB n=1 Tax=Desulfobulbus sp. TaxID=895 RepID=UPI0027B9FD2B|nr:tRNA (adenosine(37)-N6)-threonylcarbamoyltransferase complex dimerization subunit type 1 TsaB [Desulfobulbus sp.]
MADVLILAIETATGCGGVSLTKGGVDEGRVLAEYTLQPEITHSRRLLGSVGAMMEAAGVGWGDLDAVAVSLGPGSFTGLRIGMAAAKGIAMGASLPLLGVPTLDGLAAQATPTELPLCCLLDARKQQVYAAFYSFQAGCCLRTSDFMVVSAEQLAQRIQAPTLVVGPGINACQATLAEQPLAHLAPVGLLHPRAAFIGFVGAVMLAQGQGNDDLVPLYVRASEAELNLRHQ